MAFPDQLNVIEELVAEHSQLEDEPLLLAVYFGDPNLPNAECLLEVAQGFGSNEIAVDRHLFAIEFGALIQRKLVHKTRMTGLKAQGKNVAQH